MDKRKLGTILATVAGIGLFVCFILFTVGGFMSVRYMRMSALSIIGFIGFATCMALLVGSSFLRHSGDLKTLMSDADSLEELMNSANNIASSIKKEDNTVACPYCGTVFDKANSRCPNCSASVSHKD